MKRIILILLALCLVMFGCTTMPEVEPLTGEEKLAEAAEIGYMCGIEFKRTNPEHVAEANDCTNKMIAGTNVISSGDLIDSAVKLYLQENPEAHLYYYVAKKMLRLVGFELPSISILKYEGLSDKLKDVDPELLKAFLVGFSNGLNGRVAMEDGLDAKEKINGTVRTVSPKQRLAIKE